MFQELEQLRASLCRVRTTKSETVNQQREIERAIEHDE